MLHVIRIPKGKQAYRTNSTNNRLSRSTDNYKVELRFCKMFDLVMLTRCCENCDLAVFSLDSVLILICVL